MKITGITRAQRKQAQRLTLAENNKSDFDDWCESTPGAAVEYTGLNTRILSAKDAGLLAVLLERAAGLFSFESRALITNTPGPAAVEIELPRIMYNWD